MHYAYCTVCSQSIPMLDITFQIPVLHVTATTPKETVHTTPTLLLYILKELP
jgi:hypothetical protein